MKKLSATLFQNDVKYLCFPYSFVRREGLAAIVALLTHVAPVWAANLAITGAKVSSQNSPAVAYPKASHGSIVLSGDDDYCGVDYVEGRYGNNNMRTAPKITAEEEYRRFAESTVINGTSPYGFSSGQQVWTGDGLTSKGSGYMGKNSSGGDTNILPEAYGIYSFATGCGSSAQGNYSVAFGANATAYSGGSQAFGVAALAVGNASIAFGISSEATGESGIALGGLAQVKKERGIAIGTRAVSQGEESIAIGSGSKGGEENNSAIAQGNKTIAIGSHTAALGDYSLSVGADAVAAVSKSVAIGWGSVSRIAGSIYGYDPVKKAPSENDNIAWKSTVAAFSVGDPNQKITRQITGVAAGTQDTDAVNVAQLKALAQVAGGGWEVSVDGADNTVIDSGDTLNLAAGSKNFSIVSDEKEKKVTFDLAKDIALDSVKLGGEALTGAAGSVTLDATGLVISGGPQITISGINAGHKKISGLEAGTSDTDAVNFLQLKTVEKEVKEQVAASSFVKQDAQTKHISIGKNTDGGTIDIVNHEGQERTLTGIKKGALTEESHDAVTGSQLFATNQKVETVTNDLKKVAENTSQYLGGGANVLQGQKPAYMITDIRPSGDIGQTKTMHNNVGSALSSLDYSLTNVNKRVTNVVNDFTQKLTESSQHIEKDALLWNDDAHAFVADHGKESARTKSKITHILDGAISHGSTDAITGGQLYSLGGKVATYLGGGAKYEGGEWTAPTFKVKQFDSEGSISDGTYTDVASAFAGVGDSFEKVKDSFKTIKDEITKEIEKDITIAQGDSLLWSKEEQAFVALHGEGDTAKTNSKLKHLADGNIASGSTEAITGNQLHTFGDKIATYLGGGAEFSDGTFTEPTYKITSIRPSGVVGGEQSIHHNVGSALSSLDYSLTNVNTRVTNVVNDFTQKLTESSQHIEKDALLWNDDAHAFVADHGKESARTKSKITHILDGVISHGSTDAITGGQLYSMSNTLATYFGGGAKYENGNWTAPSFKVTTVKADGEAEEQTYKDVAEALAGVGNSFTNVEKKLTEQLNNEIGNVKGDSLVKKNAGTNEISIGSEVEGSKITIANKNSEDRTLSGVKAAEKGNEAVNKDQLDESLKQLSNNLQSDDSAVVHYDKAGNGNSIDYTSVTFGKGKNSSAVALHNVADGQISEHSHDVVTGGQLYSLGGKVATYLGGGAKYEGGEWTAPTFKVKQFDSEGSVSDGTYTDVASAFAGVGDSFEKVKDSFKTIKDEITKEIEKDITIAQGDSLLWSKGEQAFVALHGEGDTAKTNSKLKHLADGNIASGSTEAITGNQLHTFGDKIATYLGGGAEFSDGTFTEPTYKITSIRPSGDVGGEQSIHHNVGSALSSLDYSLTNVNTRVTNVVNDFTQKLTESSQHIEKDALLWNDDAHAFVADHGKESARTKSKITHILDGAISHGSTDAITGGQLYSMSNTLATYFGGGAKYENGNWTAPSFKVNTVSADGSKVEEKSYDNVAKAFASVGSSFTNIHNEIKNEINKVVSDNLVKQDENTKVIKIGSENDGTEITVANSEGAARSITGLKAGTLSMASTEAVNGGQLYSMSNTLATYFGGGAKYENGNWTAPSFKVTTVKADGKAEEQTYKDVAEALAGVGNSFTNVEKKLTEQLNNEIGNVKGDSLVKKNAGTNEISIGSEVEGSKITIANKNSEDRTLSGVKAAEKGNEAVNKDQLDESLKQLSNSLQSDDSAVVHYDKAGDGNSVDYTSVTFGKGKNSSAVALHNVADGQISEHSHDVVTGGQINSISQEVAKFLGGNASFNNGTFTGPTYKLTKVDENGDVKQSEFKDVGSAFEGLDTTIKNVNSNVTNKFNELTQNITNITQEVKGDALLWSESDGAFVADHGKESAKTKSKITHILDGVISHGSTDAITGGQLYSMGDALATYFGGGAKYENGNWTAPSFKVTTVKTDGKAEEQTYKDVAEALAGVGNSFTNVEKKLTEQLNNEIGNVKGDSLVKKNAGTNEISIGSEVEGSKITIANKNSEDRTLSGVKAAEKGNEAVNKDQLDESLKQLSNNLQSDDSAVVHYDKAGDGNSIDYTSVTFGKGKNSSAVALHNVADGQISEHSHDVVTGGQINSISQEVAKFLGGNASFNNGTFTEPTYKLTKVDENGDVKQSEFKDVGSAFEGLDTTIKNVNSNVTNKFNELTQNITNITQEVKGDALLWSESDGAFVADHGKESARTKSKITHILDGAISHGSTDAITGGQLYSMGDALATYFGGGAKYENGNWTAPSFKVTQFFDNGESSEKTYNNVADAFAGMNSSFEGIHNEMTNAVTNINNQIGQVVSDSLVKQDKETKHVKIGSETDGTEINIANNNKADRTLSGVKAAEKGNEAVNKDQLDESLKQLSNNLQSDDSAVVHYDKAGDGNSIDYTSVTFGKGKNSSAVALHNVADGQISEHSHDVVTGGQINSISQEVAKFLGGNASFNNGTFTEPTYKLTKVDENGGVKESEFKDVGSAFEGLDTTIKNVNSNVTNKFNELTQNITNITQEVKGDALLWSESDGAFVADHGKESARTKSKITHILDGVISHGSTDAITGGQLYSMGDALATYFGGGAKYENGNWTAPSFKVNTVSADGSKVEEKSYDNVAKAFASVGSSFTNIHNEIKNEINKVVSDNLVKQDENTKVIKIGSENDGTEITVANSEGAARSITGLKAGTLSMASTEAVNGGQLYSMSNTLATYFGGGAKYENGNWTAPSFKVTQFFDNGESSEKTYNNVADAFAGMNSSFEGIHNEVTNAVTNINNQIGQVVSDSLVKQDKETKLVKIGSETDGTEINIANNNKADRTLSGVKAAEKGNEAVNKKQLDESLKQLSNNLQSDDSAVVHYDKAGDDNSIDYTSVTFGKGKNSAAVALHNVADGQISEHSHDVVTGGQINSISQEVAKFLGGNASFNNGTFTGPTYKLTKVDENGGVKQSEFKDVGSAFEGLETTIKNVNSNVTNKFNELTQNITNITQEVKGDALLWSESDGAFVADHGKESARTKSKITHILDGAISHGSTDAITGGQLYSMGDALATYFGGGAKYENGNWTAPSFKVTQFFDNGESSEKTYNNVADAFAGMNSSFEGIHNEMTNAVTNINNQIGQVVSDSLVKQDKETKHVKIGSETDGTEINIANNNKADRTLSGVKAAEKGNEAVNKDQLDESLKQLSNNLQSDDSAVVHYDKAGDGNSIDYTSVTFGKGKNSSAVALHNVADGQISEHSHDVVTGGQINSISQEVAKFLGGNASFNNGTFTEPTYKLTKVDENGGVKESEFKDVGSAFEGLDTTIKNVNSNVTNKFNELTQNITNITQEVKGDALLWSESDGAFVADHGKESARTKSKITHILDGVISHGSTDAITGGQLYSMGDALATYFGGGAKYENGNWTAPSFKVNTVSADGSKVEEKSYDNVAKAFASVGSSFTNIHNEIKNEINKVVSDNLVKQDENTKVIKIGSENDGTEITVANSEGAARSITGLKAGTLSMASTEAVNGGQLYSMSNTLATYFGGGAKYENGNWTAPSFKVTQFFDNGESSEKTYNNVADAFAGMNSSFTKLHHELSDNIEQNALLWSETEEAFVALHDKGDGKHNSKLIHLVDGDILSGSTEAVTGNQLYQLHQTLAMYLGGGAGYKDGQWTAPQFHVWQFQSEGSKVEKKSYDNVADAFEGVNGSMSGINDRLNAVAQNMTSNSLNWNETDGGYDGRHNGQDSKITHVADGEVAKGSKEVVNGGQLWETNEKVSAVEKRVDSIDQHVQDIEKTVTNDAVKYDKGEDGKKTNKITLVGGNESDPVLIDNVSDGHIEKGSKEAINGGQLHDYTDQQMKLVLEDAKKYTDKQVGDMLSNGVNEAKAYTDMKFETLSYAVEDVRKESRQAAAIGLAVSNLRYYDIPGSLSVSFGSGVWRSQSAFAIGAGYTSEDGNIRSNLSVTSSGGHWGVGAGITLRLK